MSNMSYCRFQNTLSDLRDVAAHIQDKLSEDENQARRDLIHTCADILEEIGYSPDDTSRDLTDLIDQLETDANENDGDEGEKE